MCKMTHRILLAYSDKEDVQPCTKMLQDTMHYLELLKKRENSNKISDNDSELLKNLNH